MLSIADLQTVKYSCLWAPIGNTNPFLLFAFGSENINTPYYLMACARIDVEKPRNIQPRQHTTNTHYPGKVPANTIKRRHSIFASESALMAWDLNLGRTAPLVTSEKHLLQPHLYFFLYLYLYFSI